MDLALDLSGLWLHISDDIGPSVESWRNIPPSLISGSVLVGVY